MMKADFHMHTGFSADAQSKPEDMVEEAIRRGLKTICFTDHEDMDFPKMNGKENLTFELDTDAYVKKIMELKECYQGRMDIRLGVELGMQPHLGERYEKYTAAYPFDFVIGSLHALDGYDPYYPEAFEGKEDADVYRRAFQVTLENIQNIADLDVLGHIDYIVRYGKAKAEHYSYSAYEEEINAILRHLIEHGKGIELNTSGFKYGLGFCHPHPDVLKRYRELGGEIITVGSDAHKPEHIAYDFQKVNSILKDCGFKYYTEFEKRTPIFKQLD